ncbi:MAG: polyprenyl synthetase family protein [Bacteroidetes bacterium]|nr:polyprenyl synthetase family protein [Bacteroidota bacterium]
MDSAKFLAGQFEKYLQENLPEGKPDNLYAPIRYILNLGGKRTRPLLCILSTEAAGAQPEEAFQLAYALEVFHNFSLVHDDIMDQATMRRGQSTVHMKWNSPTAILAGDNMLVYCYSLLMDLRHPKKQEILDLFNRVAREVCEGQQMDMDFASNDNVKISEYMEMIRLKTAVLLGCCSAGGALLANSDKERTALYYQFAENLGIAFQLMDDYLDTFGDSKKTGKKQGGDIAEGKKTWLYLRAQESGLNMKQIYSEENVETRIQNATELYAKYHLDKELLKLAREYHDTSLQCLEELRNLGENTESLKILMDSLISRSH